MFDLCYAVLSVLSSCSIVSLGKISSCLTYIDMNCCHLAVSVLCLFGLTSPLVGLQRVAVVFPGHTRLLNI